MKISISRRIKPAGYMVAVVGVILIVVLLIGRRKLPPNWSMSADRSIGDRLSTRTGASAARYSTSASEREKHKLEEKRLEALNKAVDEAEKKSKAAFAAKPAPLVALGSDGRLTTEAIERLKLTEQEVESLTVVINKVRNEALDDFVNRAKLTAAEPGNNGSYQYSYFVRARSDRGKEYLDSLSKEFGSILDKDQSELLMSGLIEYDYLGCMGKHDLDLKFYSKDGGTVVTYQYLNPKNGALSLYGESSFDEFKVKFGDVFEFPEPK